MDDKNQQTWLEENKTVFVLLGAFFVLAVVIILVFVAIRMASQPKVLPPAPAPVATSTVAATSSVAVLPGIGETATASSTASEIAAEQMAEKASFGDFYHPTTSPVVVSQSNFSLPQNAKTDVANYYDVDRKISLDAGLSSLNGSGFAVLDNPFGSDADNFFSMYSALDGKQVPDLITSDFLIYYYQNVLKLAYQEVESSVFYDNLWIADQRLYQIAKQRYENDLSAKTPVNDVALEAARLETAYFATALSLLTPADSQISTSDGLSGSTNFSSTEASRYSIQLPAYLQDDVNAEVNLIRSGKTTVKSPVLLYPRDYSIFVVPDSYKSNARLNNFYLASHWLNSVFPLYYRNADCPNCLLDKDDWRINFSAAFLISSDLASAQNLQNGWAKIYKLQSFFSGLRDDLSYLNYSQSFKAVFSGQSNITQILQGAPADNDKNLTLLQNNLAAIKFSSLQGGLNKTATGTKPQLGFKMLTGDYRPDDYIFSQLVYPAVGRFSGSDQDGEKTATACSVSDQSGYYRCVGSADDILNLVYPLSASANNYFADNTNYNNYFQQAAGLQKMLSDFTVDNWHSSAYWTTMDLSAKFLRAPEIGKVAVMKNSAWQNKNLNTAIAAWANQELPADTFTLYQSGGAVGLNNAAAGSVSQLYSYIEPNLTLSRELAANTQMIIQMLSLLNVSDGENNVLSDLKTMENNLTGTEVIIAKELQNEDLNNQDFIAISNLAHAFSVSAQGAKSFKINSITNGSPLTENLSGVKLLVYSFIRGGHKYFAAGPIFNWQEDK